MPSARLLVLVALVACRASAPVASGLPSPSPPDPAPPAVVQPSSANPPPFDREAAALIVQANGPTPSDAIPDFDVDVLVDGVSILPSLKLQRTPGVVYLSGLKHSKPLEITIAAKGYLPQRRKTVLQPASNSAYFMLGRPGMSFYSIGEMMVPFSRKDTRYVVLYSGRAASNPQGRGAELKAYVARVPSISLARLEGDPARPPWYRNFVAADVTFGGTGVDRDRVIAGLAQHLRDHPSEGSLALLFNEHPRGASTFEGEISLVFKTLMDPAAIATFAANYDLVLAGTRPPFTIFAMKTPSGQFASVIEAIKQKNPNVKDVEPLVHGPIETD